MTTELAQVSERLASLTDPREVDRALRTSLQSSLHVGVDVVTEGRYPNDRPAYRVVAAVHVDGAPEDVAAARRLYSQACAPAPTETVEDWLMALQAATAGARRSDEGSAVALELYASAIRQYPADIAKSVCVHFATTSKWFPALAEIVQRCDELYDERKRIMAELERAERANASGLRMPAPEIRHIEPSRKDREAVKAMAAETIAALKDTAAKRERPSYVFAVAPVDEAGLTAEMRELIARRQAGQAL